MKSIISTINRIAKSIELRNKQKMLRIRNELFTAESTLGDVLKALALVVIIIFWPLLKK